jgi:hypothetical protein
LNTELLVCGGGLAGTLSAVAAARCGAEVTLAERNAFLGGNATAGAVGQFNGWETASGRRVIAGLAQELVDRLRHYGGARDHERFVMSNGHVMDRVEYSPELLKLVLDDMVRAAGVEVLFHASVQGVETDDGCVRGANFLTRGGSLEISCRALIDGSGDLEAMRLAGATFLALEDNERLQPATLMFRFGPIDFAAFAALPKAERAALAERGYRDGSLARAALHASREPGSDDAWFNIGRIEVDATDPLALSRAEVEGRQQAWRAAQFLRQEVAGCASGTLRAMAHQLGIRETRRVRGEYALTANDLVAPTQFDDVIAVGAYPIDIHTAGGGLDYRALPADHCYQIPLRALQPKGLRNALVVGRGLSATHEAQAAVRVMPIAMALGQAAGTAMGLLARAPSPTFDLSSLRVSEVQARLREAGHLLSALD